MVRPSESRLPFATANEHLCMQVMAKVLPTAKTELSEDGNVLVVHRSAAGVGADPGYRMALGL